MLDRDLAVRFCLGRRLGGWELARVVDPDVLAPVTGITNLVIWLTLYEKQRRVVPSAAMMAVRGRIQREGGFLHQIAHRLTDLTNALRSVGSREAAFPLPHGRGDEVHHGAPGIDRRRLAEMPWPCGCRCGPSPRLTTRLTSRCRRRKAE